jgi:hypothetical protein
MCRWTNDWLTVLYLCCARETYVSHYTQCMAGVPFILSYELHRTNNSHSHHQNFKLHSSLKTFGIKDNRVGWWPTLQERCPCKFHTTSFLLQIILFFFWIFSIQYLYYGRNCILTTERTVLLVKALFIAPQKKRKYLLLWNPKGHEHGRFKSYFMLLIIKWLWLPTFRRTIVPFSVLTFLEVSTLTSLFVPEVDPDKILRNVYNRLPLDVV